MIGVDQRAIAGVGIIGFLRRGFQIDHLAIRMADQEIGGGIAVRRQHRLDRLVQIVGVHYIAHPQIGWPLFLGVAVLVRDQAVDAQAKTALIKTYRAADDARLDQIDEVWAVRALHPHDKALATDIGQLVPVLPDQGGEGSAAVALVRRRQVSAGLAQG